MVTVDLNVLVERLRAAGAVGEGDEDQDLYDFAWTLDVMDDVVRVKAATRETADTPEGAFQLAVRLLEALLGSEYRTRYQSRLVVIDDGATKPEPPQRWRGGVDFGVVPVEGRNS